QMVFAGHHPPRRRRHGDFYGACLSMAEGLVEGLCLSTTLRCLSTLFGECLSTAILGVLGVCLSTTVALPRAYAFDAPEGFIQGGGGDDAQDWFAVFDEGDVYGEFTGALGEVFGAVDGVEQPEALPLAAFFPRGLQPFF